MAFGFCPFFCSRDIKLKFRISYSFLLFPNESTLWTTESIHCINSSLEEDEEDTVPCRLRVFWSASAFSFYFTISYCNFLISDWYYDVSYVYVFIKVSCVSFDFNVSSLRFLLIDLSSYTYWFASFECFYYYYSYWAKSDLLSLTIISYCEF